MKTILKLFRKLLAFRESASSPCCAFSVADRAKLERFERAFNSGSGGCRRVCECGQEFYNSDPGWTWDDGELEDLESSSAIDCDWTVGTIIFEGKEYVMDCDCWHERALKIMRWIDSHDDEIALYLSGEKEEKRRIAEAAPLVKHNAEILPAKPKPDQS